MLWSGCGELDPLDIDRKKAKEIARMFSGKKETLVKISPEKRKVKRRRKKKSGI